MVVQLTDRAAIGMQRAADLAARTKRTQARPDAHT